MPATLRDLDREAARLVQQAAPLEVRVARTQDERTACFRLRYHAVIERGWMPPDAFPDGLECDAYDADAVQLVACEGDKIVGTGRVVLPQPGRLLPTEAAFDLRCEPFGEVVEWSRNVVARTYSGPSLRLFGALLAQSWLETRARGYCHVCGNASAAVMRLHRLAANFTVTPIGPPRLYWGEHRYPVRFEFLLDAEAQSIPDEPQGE